MQTCKVEFHRGLVVKWERRIDHCNAMARSMRLRGRPDDEAKWSAAAGRAVVNLASAREKLQRSQNMRLRQLAKLAEWGGESKNHIGLHSNLMPEERGLGNIEVAHGTWTKAGLRVEATTYGKVPHWYVHSASGAIVIRPDVRKRNTKEGDGRRGFKTRFEAAEAISLVERYAEEWLTEAGRHEALNGTNSVGCRKCETLWLRRHSQSGTARVQTRNAEGAVLRATLQQVRVENKVVRDRTKEELAEAEQRRLHVERIKNRDKLVQGMSQEERRAFNRTLSGLPSLQAAMVSAEAAQAASEDDLAE